MRSPAIPRVALVLAALTALAPAALAGTEVKQSAKGVTYSVRVPGGWEGAQDRLLVVALHGQGGDHAGFIRRAEAVPAFKAALLVAPNAPRDAAWAADDLDPVGDLVREARAAFRPTRTIVFGFSRGAFFGLPLGLERPDLVDGVIACSGGLATPVPPEPAAREPVFYVIHGDADPIVPVETGRQAVHALEDAGVKDVEYEELRGVAHTLESAAIQRGLDWALKKLDARAQERVAALERAARSRGRDAAALEAALGALRMAATGGLARVTALVAKHLAAAEDAVAVAAAGALGRLGGDPAVAQLLRALESLEAAKKRPEVQKAVRAALEKISGRTFATAREWKRWAQRT